MEKFAQYVAYVKKALVQVTGFTLALLALGLLPEPYAGWLSAAAAVLTTLVHYFVENGPDPKTLPPS